MIPVAIRWIRRDLRLHDNPALHAAFKAAQSVVPCFILDPALLTQAASTRRAFLLAGLRALDADLRSRGGQLMLRQGNPLAELTRLLKRDWSSRHFC